MTAMKPMSSAKPLFSGLKPLFPGIKPAWFLMAFLSGLAIAVITENLILEHRNNRLEFSAPRTDFFAGKPLSRLKNAEDVPFVIRTTLWSGNKNHVFASAVDRFVVSYDIWAQSPDTAYMVVKSATPVKKVMHVSAKEAQAWCLSQMSLDTTGLSDKETLWARLEIQPEDPQREGSLLGSSVNSAGISLTPLIELLSRPPGSQPRMELNYDAFTLDQLKHTRGS